MEHNKLAALALACTTMLFAGGSALADPAKVKLAEEKPVIMFPDGETGRPSFLKAIRTRTDTPPARIGELQSGIFCGRTGDVVWDQKSQAALSQGVFMTFRAELEKARYPLVRTSESIFEDAKDKDKPKTSTDLQVGAFIREVSTNFCVKGDRSSLGGAYVKIFWQVFAPDQQKVLFETVTEGSYQVDNAIPQTPTAFFQQAFAMATRNLLADSRYVTAIKTPLVETAAGTASVTSYKDTIKLRPGTPSTEPLAKHITALRSAVVTVAGDSGSGSGFFVSQDGHVLTNRHVVGAARFVKVTLPTGRELVGEVLRSDTPRDIALIKTEPIAVQPMALRVGEPNVGEEVYALGSPLGDKFNTTLTRGILSGYRSMEDNRYLQSDVAILPGNSGGPLLDGQGSVVGVAVMGLGAKGVAGMNFFIPIADALAKLNIDAGR